jgi:CBS domain-containing protein
VLVDDIQLIDLFLADPGDTIGDLVGASEPVTVEPGAPLDEAIDALVGTRSRSLVVTDAEGRPLGRILADDIVDALVPDRGRIRFPRLGS